MTLAQQYEDRLTRCLRAKLLGAKRAATVHALAASMIVAAWAGGLVGDAVEPRIPGEFTDGA